MLELFNVKFVCYKFTKTRKWCFIGSGPYNEYHDSQNQNESRNFQKLYVSDDKRERKTNEIFVQ
jgi:hypothetical protein